MSMKKTLTLAGSDSSGGAGIQADLKTFQEHGVYGMNALTTIATMDPDNGWSHSVYPIDVKVVEQQLKTIFSIGIDAMKSGMLGTVDIIELGAKKIDEHDVNKYVLDPVMVCKGEDEVLQPENADAMRELLVPRALVITPNLFEASQLANIGTITSMEGMKEAAVKIHELGAKNIVIKGGKALGHEKAIDLFYDGNEFTLFEEVKIDTTYNHGAGCTFAAAITANITLGKPVKESVAAAKAFVTAAIKYGWKLNQYVGPVMHGAFNKFENEKLLITN